MTFYRFKSSSKGSRNSRIDSLLGIFGLQDRLYQGDVMKVREDIDYVKVHEVLKDYREKSVAFLRTSLT